MKKSPLTSQLHQLITFFKKSLFKEVIYGHGTKFKNTKKYTVESKPSIRPYPQIFRHSSGSSQCYHSLINLFSNFLLSAI